jgi:NhaA family Na+:H+ antiporter
MKAAPAAVVTAPLSAIRQFLKLESASGLLIVLAGILAMIAANTPLSGLYDGLLSVPVEVRVGALGIDKPLLLWINDGLMAIFFLLVGLEVKRELLEGELSEPARVALPAVAAIGGMVVPAAVYAAINWGDPVGMRGWAIPAATDIAFALGVLSLFGERVPVGLKIFLMTLAIIDDLGAIVIIALFYTSNLSVTSLVLAAAALVVLVTLNLRRVTAIAPYVITGILLWIFVLKSGVHATLAGVALAFAIPMRDPKRTEHSPLCEMEHALHPWVAYGILPLFAFANAGISLAGLGLDDLLEPVPLGIMLGLMVGKPVGVMLFAWAVVASGFARLPERVQWMQMLGAAFLCGIGFTMSLFIGALAFEQQVAAQIVSDRLGILCGSLVSAVIGYLLLRFALPTSARRPAYGTAG